MVTTRQFGGKTYRHFSYHGFKKTAQKAAERLRREGYCARVVRADIIKRSPWNVFKGPKRAK